MSETKLWYLVPLFFGLLGGIISYIGLRDRDDDMAYLCLSFGFGITVLEFIILTVVLM